MADTYHEEVARLDELVDRFTARMKEKLRRSVAEKGLFGWDSDAWPVGDVQQATAAHVVKGDPVDVANFAAFWWFKLEGLCSVCGCSLKNTHICMCDDPAAPDQMCPLCFTDWGCRQKHSEGCATIVYGGGDES